MGEFGLVVRVTTVHLLVSILRFVYVQVGYESATQADGSIRPIIVEMEDHLPQPNILTTV